MADPRRSSPSFTIEDHARRVGNYQWIEMKLFETLGGWVPVIPELDVKLRLGTQSHHHAWHAELWEQRLPELREMERDGLTRPANDLVVAFVDALNEPRAPELTLEKLVGVFRVLLPHKIATYSFHLHATSPIADAPTRRALRFMLQDECDDWREGEALVQSLLATPDDVQRAGAHQARLETLLVQAGGIAGPGSVGPLTSTEAVA